MGLPTGTISLSQVNTELCNPSTTIISLNDADVRALAQVPTGTISMDDLRGKYRALNLTGGTEFTPGDGYKYHVFTSTGPLTGDCGSGIVEYMAVGGGGGGGGSAPGPIFALNGASGGGGAGGYLTGVTAIPGSLSTTVTIGGGGAGGTGSAPPINATGSSGSDTTVPAFSITAGYGGGGGGGTRIPPAPPKNGLPAPLGSGGGAGHGAATKGIGGPQGNPGGLGSPLTSAGGGGGAGSSGGNAPPIAGGSGGAGLNAPSNFTPIPSVRPGGYSGGGGGSLTGAADPVGGGGAGGSAGTSASTNSGGGGGGSGISGQSGGNGGSGFFILRYSTSPGSSGISGGTEFTPGDGYKYCVFTGSGTLLVVGATTSVEYLVVGGGGHGGYLRSTVPLAQAKQPSGGGGGGGFRTGTIPLPVGGYTITIGSGGNASGPTELSGDPSSFHTITSAGGGGGGSNFQPNFAHGSTGGSGGGGMVKDTNPYTPFTVGVGGTGNSPPTTPPQGNPGGAFLVTIPGPTIPTVPYGVCAAGGGGGGNAAGENIPNYNLAGGDGGEGSRITWDIPTSYGTPGPNPGRYFSGGGGGGGTPAGVGSGGAGGGGAGGPSVDSDPLAGRDIDSGVNGTTNTGGGGGGACFLGPSPPSSPPGFPTNSNFYRIGGNGGSGIVIVRALV